MNGLFVERRNFHDGALSRDLAHHLFTRQLPGKIIIVAEKPAVMLSVVSKQWQRVIRITQRERASTLKALRIQELTRCLRYMQRLSMTTLANQLSTHDVLFTDLAFVVENPPMCKTLYIAQKVDDETFQRITANMPAESLVVRY